MIGLSHVNKVSIGYYESTSTWVLLLLRVHHAASIAVGLGNYRTKCEDLFLDGLEPSDYKIILWMSNLVENKTMNFLWGLINRVVIFIIIQFCVRLHGVINQGGTWLSVIYQASNLLT